MATKIKPEVETTPGTLSVISGPTVVVWTTPESMGDTTPEGKLQVSPVQPIVIGRAQHPSQVPYLDPAYTPTPILPHNGQQVLQPGNPHENNYLSRAHFMLRWASGGILLVNGVPHRDGGIRSPINGTELVSPQVRSLEPAEEYLIAHDETVVIRLPNHSIVEIRAG